MTTTTDRTAAAIHDEEEHAAHNYHPLPVVVASGDGAWVTDVEGRRYLDCLAAYSAVNFGHGNPVLVAAARDIARNGEGDAYYTDGEIWLARLARRGEKADTTAKRQRPPSGRQNPDVHRGFWVERATDDALSGGVASDSVANMSPQ